MKPDMKSEAKLKMLERMKKMATEMMGGEMKNKLDGMKKVTVAAEDTEGLKEGLEKAEEIVENDPMEAMEEMMGQDLDGDMEEGESEEHKEAVMGEESLSPEEIEQKIRELQAKLQSVKK